MDSDAHSLVAGMAAPRSSFKVWNTRTGKQLREFSLSSAGEVPTATARQAAPSSPLGVKLAAVRPTCSHIDGDWILWAAGSSLFAMDFAAGIGTGGGMVPFEAKRHTSAVTCVRARAGSVMRGVSGGYDRQSILVIALLWLIGLVWCLTLSRDWLACHLSQSVRRSPRVLTAFRVSLLL